MPCGLSGLPSHKHLGAILPQMTALYLASSFQWDCIIKRLLLRSWLLNNLAYLARPRVLTYCFLNLNKIEIVLPSYLLIYLTFMVSRKNFMRKFNGQTWNILRISSIKGQQAHSLYPSPICHPLSLLYISCHIYIHTHTHILYFYIYIYMLYKVH